MKKMTKIGMWLFLIGVVGAGLLGVIKHFGIYQPHEFVLVGLGVVGALIGLMNISKKEANTYMISAILLAGGVVAIAVIPIFGGLMVSIFSMIAIPVVTGAIVVAVKSIYTTSK